MKLDFDVQGKTLVVRAAGELDLGAAAEFRREVDMAIDRNCTNNLILNLGGVNFIDSSGLGAILGRYRRVSMLGGRMAIVGAPTQVRRILELSGVTNIAGTFEDENEALKAM